MEYQQIKKDILKNKTKIDDGKYSQEVVTVREEVLAEKEKVADLYQTIKSLQILLDEAIKLECDQLWTTVNAINCAMEETLNIIFDEPISIKLSVHKTMKNKKTKPGVNIKIWYRGAEYDNITTLSGGEADRISFALLLALSRVSPSNLIMLDECTGSLNGELREKCIDSLREVVGNTKTILCIAHEDVEGQYDNIINI